MYSPRITRHDLRQFFSEFSRIHLSSSIPADVSARSLYESGRLRLSVILPAQEAMNVSEVVNLLSVRSQRRQGSL